MKRNANPNTKKISRNSRVFVEFFMASVTPWSQTFYNERDESKASRYAFQRQKKLYVALICQNQGADPN